jgi:hypothetical protein
VSGELVNGKQEQLQLFCPRYTQFKACIIKNKVAFETRIGK